MENGDTIEEIPTYGYPYDTIVFSSKNIDETQVNCKIDDEKNKNTLYFVVIINFFDSNEIVSKENDGEPIDEFDGSNVDDFADGTPKEKHHGENSYNIEDT